MKRTLRTSLPAALLCLLAHAAAAQAPAPGSVLVFPLHDSRSMLTIVSVTNTNTGPGGDVRALFRYVNATPSANPLKPGHCSTVFRGELLTPGDTVSVLTSCHDVADAQGFLVVSAQHATAGYAVARDDLIGSALIVHPQGSVYALQAYSFGAVAPQGSPTDADLDGLLDFDGTEYESLPRLLFADTFLAIANTRLTLLHLAPTLNDDVVVKLDIQNDNEFPLSITLTFRCWFEVPLAQLGAAFTQPFLANTPNDPNELDVSCDGVDDFETGWFRIRPLVASGIGSTPDPAVLGALTAGPFEPEGGRLLWGSGATSASF